MSATIDASRLSFILNELRLPAIKNVWPKFAERVVREQLAQRLARGEANHRYGHPRSVRAVWGYRVAVRP
jgi:hypothetical protein